MKHTQLKLCTLSVIALIGCFLSGVHGHGMLLDPPGRASAWRAGFLTPTNYDDNALYCGGRQGLARNRGKCGVCGDPWDGVRENEAGGKYATGTIVRNYTDGQVIHARIQLTANHFGWMEFRLCPNNNVHKPVTHDCLNKHLLELANGAGTRYYVKTGRTGYYDFNLKLPDGLTCTQCVLQWKYHSGNDWGVDPVTGRGCVGCGPQEEFYGCADIQIRPNGNAIIPTTRLVTPSRFTVPNSTETTRKICKAISYWSGIAVFDQWCTDECQKGHCPSSTCQCVDTVLLPLNRLRSQRPTTTTTTTTTTTAPSTPVQCKAKGNFGSPQWDNYCKQQCDNGYCATSVCSC